MYSLVDCAAKEYKDIAIATLSSNDVICEGGIAIGYEGRIDYI